MGLFKAEFTPFTTGGININIVGGTDITYKVGAGTAVGISHGLNQAIPGDAGKSVITIEGTDMSHVYTGSTKLILNSKVLTLSADMSLENLYAGQTELMYAEIVSPYNFSSTINPVNINGAFNGCSKLITAKYSSDSHVSHTGYFNSAKELFKGCAALVNISSIYIKSGGDTTDMFTGCTALADPDAAEQTSISNTDYQYTNSNVGSPAYTETYRNYLKGSTVNIDDTNGEGIRPTISAPFMNSMYSAKNTYISTRFNWIKFNLTPKGTLELGDAEISDIQFPKEVITKEYLDHTIGGLPPIPNAPTGLEKVSGAAEKFGWRLIGVDHTKYGTVGEDAVDLSVNTSSSAAYGALGKRSFAAGASIIASGDYSVAMGVLCTASEKGAICAGYKSKAIGKYSVALGEYVEASNTGSVAMGSGSSETNSSVSMRASGVGSVVMGYAESFSGVTSTSSGGGSFAAGYSTDNLHLLATGAGSSALGYGVHATNTGATALGYITISKNKGSLAAGKYNVGTSTNTILEIGIGTGPAANERKNVLEAYLDGKVFAPDLTISKILAENTTSKVLITKEYLDSTTYIHTGLTKTEGATGKYGYRLAEVDNAEGGVIGENAIDIGRRSPILRSYGAAYKSSIAIGDAVVNNLYGIAIGNNTWVYSGSEQVSSRDRGGIAIGFKAICENLGNIAIGTIISINGLNTIAIGNTITQDVFVAGSIMIGNHPDTTDTKYTDANFVIGIGTSTSDRKNLLWADPKNVLSMDNTIIADITARGAKALITREYLVNYFGLNKSTGLQKITETGGGIGWAFVDRVAANYGPIGTNAVDLSYSSAASTSRGATGETSVAMNGDSMASGKNTLAAGYQAESTHENAVALGYLSKAKATYAVSLGNNNEVSGSKAIAIGSTNIVASTGTDSVLIGTANASTLQAGMAFGNSLTIGVSNQVVLGRWNLAKSTNYFEVGIGTAIDAKKNGLEINTDGVVQAPEASIAGIAAKPQALITRAYADAKFEPIGTGIPVVDITWPELIAKQALTDIALKPQQWERYRITDRSNLLMEIIKSPDHSSFYETMSNAGILEIIKIE